MFFLLFLFFFFDFVFYHEIESLWSSFIIPTVDSPFKGDIARALPTMKVPIGFFLTIGFIFFLELITFRNAYHYIWKNVPVWGVLMALLQFLVSSLMLSALGVAALVDSGRLPSGLIATNVEALAREELQKYANMLPMTEDQDLKHDEKGSQVDVQEDEETINANQLASERAEARMKTDEAMLGQEPTEFSVHVGHGTSDGADHPDAVDARRRRKIRSGLPVLSLPEVARNILEGVNAGGDQKRDELAKLFDKVVLCPYCQVYKLDRTYHCDLCKRCVPQCSHHCFSISQCVGYTNHKAYFLFIAYSILAAFHATVMDLWVEAKGWNPFFSVEHANFLFYLSYNCCAASAVVLSMYLFTHIRVVGCGESMITEMKRQDQKIMESTQRNVAEYCFAEVPQEEIILPRKGFKWSNVKAVFGNETKFYRYFLPFFEPKLPSDYEQSINVDLKEFISMRLHSLADIIPDDPLPE